MYQSNFSPTFGNDNKDLNSRILIDCPRGSYSRNSSGFIRNDFSELMDSQDALSMSRALQKMQEYANNEPDNSKKTFEEIVAMVRPRWCQSPAEMDRFEVYCIDNALETYSKLKNLDEEQKEALAKAKREELVRQLKEQGIEIPAPVPVETKNE